MTHSTYGEACNSVNFQFQEKKVPPLAFEGTRHRRGTQTPVQAKTHTHKYNKLKMEKVHIRSVSRLARVLKLCHWGSMPHLSTPEDTRRHSRSSGEEHLHRVCFPSRRKWWAARPCMPPGLGRIFPKCLKGIRIRPCVCESVQGIPTVLCAQTSLTTAASLCTHIYLLTPSPPPLEAHLSCVTFSTIYCPLLKQHISYT